MIKKYDGSAEYDKNFLLCLFVFLLTAMGKAHIRIGPVPLYFCEMVLVIVLLKKFNFTEVLDLNNKKRILLFAKLFFLCVVAGEVHGAISYNFILPAIYQIVRYALGIYLLIKIPLIVRDKVQFQTVLKAIVIGMLFTGIISTFTSLPNTRNIAKYIFSFPFMNPTKDRLLVKSSEFRGEDFAIRGASLVGTSTVTGAYLCTMWPLGILAYRRLLLNKKWKILTLIACIIAPIGALATYSRSSWLGILLIFGMIGVFGFSGGRKLIILLSILLVIIVSSLGLESKYLFIDRIERRTEATFNNPMASSDVRERFLSYTEPISHLFTNPIWLFFGAGTAGGKMLERGIVHQLIFDESKLATHSVISLAYYAYGLPGMLCHICLMVSFIALILKNLKVAKGTEEGNIYIWQMLFASLVGGVLPWWLFGHAAVSTARGSMFLFFIYAIILTCNEIQYRENYQ